MEAQLKRKVVFVSNYINHHQIPFCRAMCARLGGSFAFIQTEPMEEERKSMGWGDVPAEEYLYLYYEAPKECDALINNADIVLWGWTEKEDYLQKRLAEKKPVIRVSERIYKEGQWKAISPRGLLKKYQDHTKYRKGPVYLLCSGAYVPSDFQIIHAYPKKMFAWGYFPETKAMDVEKLLAEKGHQMSDGTKVPSLLWTARLIELKHPELAIETAQYLKSKGIPFHLNMIGGGAMEAQVKSWIRERGLEEEVSLLGFMKPAEVRACMEQADVFLFTSDRREGWGAVVNESMNSACVPVVGHMAGAAPYLIRHGENGFVYRDGDPQMLFKTVEKLLQDEALRKRLGKNAYQTIVGGWNAENAALRLCRLIEELTGLRLDDGAQASTAECVARFLPCDPAPVISERKMFRFLTEK
ncbi:MAG: glycosyltransferase [Lachnospiraceae bacterium]|nr:glycosyltransferase [Lachnospiraceae bacterium]